EGDRVIVEMNIDRRFTLKKDSVARLDFRALSGERFVAISLGTPTAKEAEAGDTLEGETPASFSDVVDKLSTVADDVSQLTQSLSASSERLLTNLADVIDENRSALGDVAQHMASITGKLD